MNIWPFDVSFLWVYLEFFRGVPFQRPNFCEKINSRRVNESQPFSVFSSINIKMVLSLSLNPNRQLRISMTLAMHSFTGIYSIPNQTSFTSLHFQIPVSDIQRETFVPFFITLSSTGPTWVIQTVSLTICRYSEIESNFSYTCHINCEPIEFWNDTASVPRDDRAAIWLGLLEDREGV